MQPLNEAQTQRVWSRVMNAQAAPAAAMENGQENSLTEQRLLTLIDDERRDSATYLHLAGRMKGKAQAMLRRMAQEEACHARKLGAIYFLLTGKRVCAAPARPECVTCINETLRQRYEEEHPAHEMYAAMAETAGTYRCTLETIAAEECRHAGMILCILQECL